MARASVKDVLAFHKIDREAYEEFVARGTERNTARHAVALHKDSIVSDLAKILDGIGRLVFNDHMYELWHAYESKAAMVREAIRKGSSAVMPAVPPALAVSYVPAPVLPIPSTEDARSMVIAFSKGFPIGRDEIWGIACMQEVGRLHRESDMGYCMAGLCSRVVRYNINGRPQWACKYVPNVPPN